MRRRITVALAAPALAFALVLTGCGSSSSGGSSSTAGTSAAASGGTSAANSPAAGNSSAGSSTGAEPSTSGSAATSAASSANPAFATAPASADKGTLTLAFETDPYGWDPSSQPGYQNWAADAIWDQLVFCGPNGELEPGAADTWKISNQNKTFTAHIREGMKFSDGTPVDSAAVKASFDFASKNGGATNDYKGIKIETKDAQTFAVTWPEPQPILNSKVCNPKISTAAYLAAKKFDAPLGSGPYVLDTANTTNGSVYTFTKNPDYWNAGLYPYSKLVIKVVANPAAAVGALKTGQIDAGLVGQNDINSVKGSGLDVLSFQGQTTRLLLTDHLGKVVPPIGNLKVRQAINMVFDKAAMAKSLYQGNAEPTAQVFRKGSDAYIDGLADPYPYDVAKAKQLMTEAGYADGFSLELPTMTGQNFETLMPYVTQQLAQINIKVTQVPLSGANAITDLLSGKYPVVLWQLGNFGYSPLQIYIESTPDGWWNLEHQPDEYVDSRWTQMGTADPATSKKLQQEINQYQVDQAWFAPMVYMGTNFAHATKVNIPTQSDQEGLTPRLRDFQ
jgi:peptide/nickel transport system substrate-binding protein